MTQLIAPREQATPGATSQNISMRLRALSVRPEALTVRKVIDDYMAQYAGHDPSRTQRLSAWLATIGEFTLEQVDSDHVCRNELQTTPPLVFVGLDHLGQQIFKRKRGALKKTTATVNRYMQAISAVFTWVIEQRLCPKSWVHPCRGIKRLPDGKERVRFLDAAARTLPKFAMVNSLLPRIMKLGFRMPGICGRPRQCCSPVTNFTSAKISNVRGTQPIER